MHSNTRQAVRVDAFGLREMVLGKSRQAHQRTIMHSNTRQAANNHALEHSTGSEQSCTRTLDRQRTIMHSNTRQALNTRSVYAKWYWVNHGRLTSERQAHQRKAGSPAKGRLTSECKAYLPLPIVTHQSLDPAARALKRKLLVFYASTRSRRAVEVIIMHDRSLAISA